MENLALACQGCNSHKATHVDAIDPVSGSVTPLYHPRRHVWHDHFEWSEDFHLNREGVTNLRRVLRLSQQHPPEP